MKLFLSLSRPERALALAVLITGLGACGGGGGGGGGSLRASPAVINAGNSATITQEVIGVGLGAGEFGDAIGGGGILAADGGSNALALGRVRPRTTIQKVQPRARFGPEVSACRVSGSLVLSGSLSSNSTVTPGDRIDVEANSCDDGDGAIYDGGFGIAVTRFSGDILTDQYLLGADLTLTNFGITEAGVTTTADGVVEFELDLRVPLVGDTSVDGALLEFRSGSDAWILRDFAVSLTEDGRGANLLTRSSGTGTLEGSGFSGAVDFVTVVPFVATGNDYPASGEALITGASGATIRATAIDAVTLQLAIDLDGDSVVDETQQIPWSSVGGPG